MGRRDRRRRKGPRRERTNTKEDRDTYVSTVVEHGNFKMEAYYAAQGVHDVRWKDGKLIACETDEERNEERSKWRSTISEILPATFRIGKDVPDAMRDSMEAELQDLLETARNDDTPEEIVQRLSFHPHAFQLAMDRATIRRHPTLAPLHHWLKQQTESGCITRQETVSMIPPVVLNPQPSDMVLDMCAAPGSKTSQLLEELGTDGCLVANDSSRERAYMLVHQLRRIMHMNPNVLITNCDAQFFPNVVQFDKILADVPCSGDGTSRKNIGIWKQWFQMAALGLHKLQLDIAWKGVHLLKIGGHMVYSTCSFNPTENEAVVAELLRRAEGSLELVTIDLPGFDTRPGWKSWKVFCEDKSRREMKDYGKKNNVYMQIKRKEWSEKNTKDVEDGAKDEGGVEADENGKKEAAKGPSNDTAESTPAETETAQAATLPSTTTDNGDGKPAVDAGNSSNGQEPSDYQKDLDRTFRKFEPTSWDEDALLAMTKEAGLLHIPTLDDVPKKLEKRVRPSCFPPTPQEVERFHLDRCIRCLPHDMDTGGFFVALLRKVAPLKEKKERNDHADDVVSEQGPETKRAKLELDEVDEEMKDAATSTDDLEEMKDAAASTDDLDDVKDAAPAKASVTLGQLKGNLVRDKDGNKDPELGKDDFVPVSDDVMQPLIDYYGLSEDFPRDLYMTRASGDSKIIYYIGRPIKNLIDLGLQKRLTIVNSGLKAFVRNNKDCECRYRIAQEGVHFMAPYIKKRMIVINRDDFLKCISPEPTPIAGFTKAMQDAIRPMGVGSFVVALEGFEDEHHRKMMMTMWRCRGDNTNSLVNKVELAAMKDKLQATENEN